MEKVNHSTIQKTTEASASKAKSVSLDIYRILAMLLVLFGHFVGTASYAYDVPNVINGTLEETILRPDGFFLLKIDGFFYYNFGIQAACVGVVMFFLCTGYLIAGMMERYTPAEFLINRLFRVFPTLAVCVAFNGIFLTIAQNFHFSFMQFFSSVTMTYVFFAVVPIMGVLWTLAIELNFYLLAACIRKFNKETLLLSYGLIILLNLAAYEFPQNQLLYHFAYNSRYIAFCLLGASLWRLEQDHVFSLTRWAVTVGVLCLNILLFKAAQPLFSDTSTYPHIFTHILPLALFLLLKILDQVKEIKAKRTLGIVKWMAGLVFTMYLTHVVVGFNCMYFLRKLVTNNYLLLLIAGAASFLVAWLLSLLIEKPSVKASRAVISKLRAKRNAI